MSDKHIPSTKASSTARPVDARKKGWWKRLLEFLAEGAEKDAARGNQRNSCYS
jgi:hypothetical protein